MTSDTDIPDIAMATDIPVPGPSITVPSGRTGALAEALRNAVPYSTFVLEDGVYKVRNGALMQPCLVPTGASTAETFSESGRESRAGSAALHACATDEGLRICILFVFQIGTGWQCLLT